MQKFLVVVGLPIVFLALGALDIFIVTKFVTDPFGSNLRDFVTLAGMGLTFVAAFMTGVISIANMLAQLGTAKELELLKPLLALEYPAFKDLNNAALTYHDVLSRLDTGNYNPQLAEAAEVEMKKSYGVLWFMSQKYQDAWWDYWTQARKMKETMSRELNNASFNQKEYWSKRCGDGARLSHLLKSLREATPRRKK